jgi:hypothetical protein
MKVMQAAPPSSYSPPSVQLVGAEHQRAQTIRWRSRMSHIKATPDLSFIQADVSAAVDVMYPIDKVAAGAKRTSIGSFGGDDDSLPRGGMVDGMDFDDLDFDDDDGWIDDDEDDEE